MPLMLPALDAAVQVIMAQHCRSGMLLHADGVECTRSEVPHRRPGGEVKLAEQYSSALHLRCLLSSIG